MMSALPARLAVVFLRIGNLTFGGGDPTMAALQRELVDRRGWLTTEQYGLLFALARITPGTNVLAFCAGAGWRILGWRGAVLAVLCASGPSAILAVWLLSAYRAGASNFVVAAAMAGISAAIVGVMMAGAWLLVKPQFRGGNRLRPVAITGAAFVLAAVLAWPPVPILALAALAGWLWKEPRT